MPASSTAPPPPAEKLPGALEPVRVNVPLPVWLRPPEPLTRPEMVILPGPAKVKALLPVRTIPPIVRELLELFVQV